MRTFVSLLVLAVFNIASSGLTWGAELTIFGTFALCEVSDEWRNVSTEDRQKAEQEVQTLLESHKSHVTVDAYWTYGPTRDSHFMLRLHSKDLQANQQLLTHSGIRLLAITSIWSTPSVV